MKENKEIPVRYNATPSPSYSTGNMYIVYAHVCAIAIYYSAQ